LFPLINNLEIQVYQVFLYLIFISHQVLVLVRYSFITETWSSWHICHVLVIGSFHAMAPYYETKHFMLNP